MMAKRKIHVGVNLAGLELETPILVASGTYGWGTEFAAIDAFRSDAVGAILLKGTTLSPREGNRTPRIVETAGGAGILNAIGLQNPGAQAVVETYLPRLEGLRQKVIANVAGETVGEYAEVTRLLASHERIDAVEVNVSCPNVKRGGMQFGADAAACGEVVSACRKTTDKPLIVKLTPNVTDIRIAARAAVDAGADVLTVANTVLGTAVDVHTRRAILGNVSGGLSGPAIKPIALQKVLEVVRFLKEEGLSTPVIASGGIMTAEDALEFLITGAGAFALGTVLLADFRAPEQILEGIGAYMAQTGVTDIREVVGTLEVS